MKFNIEIKITPDYVFLNNAKVMSSMYPKDMRVPTTSTDKNLVFRPDQIQKHLRDLGINVPKKMIKMNSSFTIILESDNLYVACYDPHLVDCEPVADFEEEEPEVSETYREEYFILLKNIHDIPVTKENKVNE